MSALLAVHVCPPDHRHGATGTCYKTHGCRCLPCRSHNTAQTARRHRLMAYGRYDNGLVDAEPVRAHLRHLAEFGIGYKQAAILAGISPRAVAHLLHGRYDAGSRHGELPARCPREKAAAILAVRADIDSLADGARIPSRGAHRRVQALVALGWSTGSIARRLPMRLTNFLHLLEQDQVTARRHRQIAALYEELSARRPTPTTPAERGAVTRALRTAAARGWVTPLAWDDIDQDVAPAPEPEPGDEIDDLAVEHALAGHRLPLTRPELVAVIRRASTAGASAAVLADRYGLDDRTITRLRTGRP